ncbi:MFS transporter [Oceanobacillus arenosus]|uniref:MFS transporter n=1 Tax=Oceanobacillus arenosus TaxID=1229153 RepID=A0A3D8PIY7_9BACI|nr:MFS transporter [Oceanobacillus arenosus]
MDSNEKNIKFTEDFASKTDASQLAPNSTLSRYTELLLAIACGMAVANIYFAHPLLDSLATEFNIDPSTIGIVITVSQICYALGLLLLVPLGDLLNQRHLIIGQMFMLVAALVVVGVSPNSIVFFIGIAVVGLLASVTQTLVAYASTSAVPAERGRVVGFVTSGVVIGIILARTFAGIMADLGGWRSVYLSSAVLILILIGLLHKGLPGTVYQRPSLSYPKLLHSVLMLFVQERILLIRGILALLIFIVFSTFWTSLVLPLSSPPYSFSHTAIGAFGLAGVSGALAAARAGRLADRGLGQLTTFVALVLLIASWFFIYFINDSILVLIIGIILLDLAVQAVHVTNQSLIFTARPGARSRLTAAYMVFYSVGSATGSILSTNIYANYGWNGVCLFGVSVSALALIFWIATYRPTKEIMQK